MPLSKLPPAAFCVRTYAGRSFGLSELPHDLSCLKRLTSLDASSNALASLPEAPLRPLTQLRSLNLVRCFRLRLHAYAPTLIPRGT